MWANAQRDGRPAEYRWRPLFNAAVWLTPTTTVLCSNAAKMRNLLNLTGVPQTNEPTSATSVDTCLSCKDIARQSCAMACRWRTFGNFLHPVFLASGVQHISDMHSKFTLRPHHVQKYGTHPICDG